LDLATRPRIEETVIESVDRYVHDTFIVIEYLRCSISNMNIPIKYDYSLHSELLLSVPRSYSSIVEETEARYVSATSVMTRRPYNAKGGTHLT
jgi:hypothetical protein